jgi:hypothetical protein
MIARRDDAATDPVVEHLVAAHQRIHHEKEKIDRAIQANPGDPALTRRIEKLTAEVEGIDRDVLQRRPAAQAFGAEGKRPSLRCRLRRDHRPKLHRLVRVSVVLLMVSGIVHFVAVALTQGQHQTTKGGSAETAFREPGSSGYTSSELASIVEGKVTEEGVFSPASETIACPPGTYPVGALVTCTLHSPSGGGKFDVEVTGQGISIEMSGEAK